MIPIISIIGWSDSGKTTFITKLIPELKSRGYKVATIKHNAHKFKIDKPGKDSWQHRQAGAETVVLSSSEKVAVIKEITTEVKVQELVTKYIEPDYDLVIVEGNKEGPQPKIEIFRPGKYEEPVLAREESVLRIINRATEDEQVYSPEQINKAASVIEELT